MSNITSNEFATIWPKFESEGWTLERHGMGYYVTPPADDPRREWGGVWTYVGYQDKVVYVPHWFQQEPPTTTNSPLIVEMASAATRPESKKKKRVGWGKWMKSFIW